MVIAKPMLGRWIVLAAFALIVWLAQYKAQENRASRLADRAWQDQMAQLRSDQAEAFQALQKKPTSIASADQARAWLTDWAGDPTVVKTTIAGEEETISCRHPHHGVELEYTFAGELTGSTLRSNLDTLTAMYPQPVDISRTGTAEQIRQALISLLGFLWLVAVTLSLVSRRWGMASAWTALLVTFALGAAWVVDPLYSLDLRGITSNDTLFGFLIMYPIAIGSLANHYVWRSRQAKASRGTPPVQFNLRSLLLVTTVTALLLAIGPLGYLAVATIVVGYGLFWLLGGYLAMLRAGGGLLPPAAVRLGDDHSDSSVD